VLLTGGTNGGATEVTEAARLLQQLAPGLPAVVAANEGVYEAVGCALGDDRLVRFANNVMPRVGELASAPAQAEIRALFVDHVIGSVKLAGNPTVARAVRMPTPAAVLRATEAIARSRRSPFERPVVVDLGGATTDVHSVLPVGGEERGYTSSGLETQAVTRTVEGDLGMRENAPALVAVARADGLLDAMSPADLAALESGADRRARDHALVPSNAAERRIDEQLAQLATEIAIARHAGVVRTTLTATGAVLIKTGRDLRRASCVIATGGVFRHSGRARQMVVRAWDRVASRGGLVTAGLPVFVDRSYVLWAVGLLSLEHQPAADGLIVRTLIGDDR
jgi:uncharacterized protein (TIGR01319 family)